MFCARKSFLAIINRLWSPIASGFCALQAYMSQVQKGQGSSITSPKRNKGKQDQTAGSPATTYRVSSFISPDDRDSKEESIDDYERASRMVKHPKVRSIVAQVADTTGPNDTTAAYPEPNSISTNANEGQPLAQSLVSPLFHFSLIYYLFPRIASAILILNPTAPEIVTVDDSVIADNSNVELVLDDSHRMECHVRCKKGFYVVELPDTNDDNIEQSKDVIEPDGDTAVQNGSVPRTNTGRGQPLSGTLDAISILNVPSDTTTTTATTSNDNFELDGVESFLGIPFLLNFGTGASPDDALQRNIVSFLETNEDEDIEPLPLYIEPPFYSVAIRGPQEGRGEQQQEDHNTVVTPPPLSLIAAFDNVEWEDSFSRSYQAPPPYGLSLSGFGSQEEDSLIIRQNDDHDGLDIHGDERGFQLLQQQGLREDQWASTAYIEPESSGIVGTQRDNLLGLIFSFGSSCAPLRNNRH